MKQLTFHANAFQIDGGGLSRGALYNFMVASGIEAIPTTRLYEIWLEQMATSSHLEPDSWPPIPNS